MKSKRQLTLLVTAFIVVFGFLTTTAPAFAAAKEKVLYRFWKPGGEVQRPGGPLVSDAAGNLYGTAPAGGANGFGTVYEMVRGANGHWSEKVLYSFAGGSDGTPNPSLVFDPAGNLYGTTNQGGTYSTGTVFELTPGSGGTWTETVLYSFNPNNGTDGIYPASGPIIDAAGNLYGATMFGGNYQDKQCAAGCGAVFKLAPGAGGIWTESTLYALVYIDGYEIFSNLAFDSAGNLYGMATWGGTGTCYQDGSNYGCGTVFELTPKSNGKWTFKRLYSFQGGTDGSDPVRTGSLVFDNKGALYGSTSTGGNQGCSNRYYTGCGTAFQLTPKGNGKWTEKVLHRFGNKTGDGAGPSALTFDAAGNLYGAADGGAYSEGAVFELAPGANGKWTEKVLYSFGGKFGDAVYPTSPLILDSAGNLYGTAGLTGYYGAFYEIIP